MCTLFGAIPCIWEDQAQMEGPMFMQESNMKTRTPLFGAEDHTVFFCMDGLRWDRGQEVIGH